MGSGKKKAQVTPEEKATLQQRAKQTEKFLKATDHYKEHGVPQGAQPKKIEPPKKKFIEDLEGDFMFDLEKDRVELEMDPEEAWIVCADEINELEEELAHIRKQKKIYEQDAAYWKKEKLIQSAKDDIGEKEAGKLREGNKQKTQEIMQAKTEIQQKKNEGAGFANENQQLREEILEIQKRLFKRGVIQDQPRMLPKEEGEQPKNLAVNRRNMEKMKLVRQMSGTGVDKMQFMAKFDESESDAANSQSHQDSSFPQSPKEEQGALMKLLLRGPFG